MNQYIENASPQKVLYVAVAFMAVTWIGGKLSGTPASDTELIGLASIVVVYAILDHLYGIRRAIEQQNREAEGRRL